MLTSSLRGLVAALRQPKLAVLLWIWNLLVGLIVTWPVWTWWSGAVRYSPGTDPMLDRFHFGILKELLHADRTPVMSLLGSVIVAAMAFMLIANPALSGGTIETLLMENERVPRGFLRRFFRGAGQFYIRFAMLLALTLAGGTAAVLLVALLVGLVVSPLSWSGWELGWIVQFGVVAAAIGMTMMLFAIALDYARIRLAMEDSRRVVRIWFGALVLVVRHPLRTFGIRALFGILLLALVVAYTCSREAVPATTWGTILVMGAMQQVFMLGRSGLRVATIASQMDAYVRWHPAPPAATPPVSGIDAAPPTDLSPYTGDDLPLHSPQPPGLA